tara:strand:+ start:650 stop:1828 length:1179 start_codon:yes stop_codon:yes gene_type:complete
MQLIKNILKNIFLTEFIFKNKYIFTSILLSFFLISYYHLSIGYVMSSDSYTYSTWADDLIKLKFNLKEYYLQNSFIVSSVFYTTPVILAALCKFFFGTEWQYAFLFLNMFFLFLSLIIFTKSLLILNVRPILIFITMPTLVVSVDLLVWPRYILSDMSFAFLVVLITYVIIRCIVKNKFDYSIIFLLTLMILISRPSSLPVVFAILSFILISKASIYKNIKLTFIIIFTIFMLTPCMFTILYYFIELNYSENIQLSFLTEMVKSGMIIHDRPETWIAAPNTFIDILKIYFLRLVNFFNPYAESFSTIHIILNSFQFFLVLLSSITWIFIGGNVKSIDRTILFILLLSFSVASFHAFTLIDYDWRYRFPTILPLIMILPLSMEIFLKKIIRNP